MGPHQGPDDGIPAAFRGKLPAPRSFTGLDDSQVLKLATAAFNAAQALPLGPAREREWEKFDDAMSELAARALRHALRKLRERGDR